MRHLYLIFAVMLLAANTSCAASPEDVKKPKVDESQNKSAVPPVDNIGFMKNPPKALTERFPMCDAFLDVEWINKEEKVGLTHYEAIMKNKDGSLKGRKDVLACINMKRDPLMSLEVSEFKRKGKLDEVLELVRHGKRNKKPDLTFEYKGKVMTFWEHFNLRNYDEHYPLLSDHTQSVCITYPDEQRAWIKEGRSVKNTYSKARREELYKQVKEAGSHMTMAQFERQRVHDVNFDGADDYSTSFISYRGKLHLLKVEFEIPDLYKFTFPPNNRICHQKASANYQIVTDGKSYFLKNNNSTCNLTELTSPMVKE